MRKFIINFLLFLLPIFAYIIFAFQFLPKLLVLYNGPSTEQQITTSFKNALNRDYDLIILGNSRTYRGINPDNFSISAYNFSHDNDSYNQIYYKLLYLESKGKKIKYLVLGVDFFQFSFLSNTRNYVYGEFLGDCYLNDYKDFFFSYKFNYYLDYINPQKIKHLKNKNDTPYLKENGQYIKHGILETETFAHRDISRLKIQEKYFEKIINFCQDRNIIVFLVMLPTREKELESYTNEEIVEFNSFIEKYIDNRNIYYLNFCSEKTLSKNDYSDLTHLNEQGANKFSRILNDSLENKINN